MCRARHFLPTHRCYKHPLFSISVPIHFILAYGYVGKPAGSLVAPIAESSCLLYVEALWTYLGITVLCASRLLDQELCDGFRIQSWFQCPG